MFELLFPAFYHLDGGDSAFITFIAKHAAASLLCLFKGIAGEQTVDDGYLAFAIQVGQALRRSLTDIFEVGGVAANDAANGYHDINQT